MPPTPPMQPLVASTSSSLKLFHDEALILGYVLCALMLAGMCIAAWISLGHHRAVTAHLCAWRKLPRRASR